MGACAFTGIQYRDVIVFQNLRFQRIQQKGVFKIRHSGERFRKDAFSVTAFAEDVLTVSQSGGKFSVFKQQQLRMDRALDYSLDIPHSPLNYDIISALGPFLLTYSAR